MKKHASKVRFALVGGINTALDFSILLGLSVLGVNAFIANFISTSVAFVFSFFANKNYTFKSKSDAKKQLVPFTVVTLAGLWVIQPLVIAVVLFIAPENLPFRLFFAKLIATLGSLTWNYLLYSRFVFKDHSPERED